MNQAIDAAHRALHGVFVQGRPAQEFLADIETAGDAFIGVLNAFFRNVMEAAFTGQETVRQTQTYLEDLKRAYPAQLAALQPAPMAAFVQEQIGPGAPPSGQSRMPWTDGLIFQMRLLAEYTARREGIFGEQLARYLQGACGRYYLGES